MVRHAITDTPTRGVVEYWWHYYDGQPSEKNKLVVGPYDKLHNAKRRTYQEARASLINLDNPNNSGRWTGWSEIIEIRFERVKEWEVLSVEFKIP